MPESSVNITTRHSSPDTNASGFWYDKTKEDTPICPSFVDMKLIAKARITPNRKPDNTKQPTQQAQQHYVHPERQHLISNTRPNDPDSSEDEDDDIYTMYNIKPHDTASTYIKNDNNQNNPTHKAHEEIKFFRAVLLALKILLRTKSGMHHYQMN